VTNNGQRSSRHGIILLIRYVEISRHLIAA
jgi:hypothetical protein